MPSRLHSAIPPTVLPSNRDIATIQNGLFTLPSIDASLPRSTEGSMLNSHSLPLDHRSFHYQKFAPCTHSKMAAVQLCTILTRPTLNSNPSFTSMAHHTVNFPREWVRMYDIYGNTSLSPRTHSSKQLVCIPVVPCNSFWAMEILTKVWKPRQV